MSTNPSTLEMLPPRLGGSDDSSLGTPPPPPPAAAAAPPPAPATETHNDDGNALSENGQGLQEHIIMKPEFRAQHAEATTPTNASEQLSTGAVSEAEKQVTSGPTPLPYNLREHKLTITLFWTLILTECTLIPIIFYFTIANLTDMRRGAMFAIITAMFGFISGGEYGLRGLRLCLKRDEYRPLNGAGRWGFDSTHLVLGPPYFFMTALMIGFSIPDPPIMRGLSMIMPVGIIMGGVTMIATGIAHHFRWRLPVRLSSHVKGDITPPLTFCIMEDITACDGGGGKKYREAALARYNESPRFRRMLVQMLWAWSTTAVLLGIILTIIIWLPEVDQELVYALGWGIPSVWGGVGAWLTIKWGQRCISIEREKWAEDQAARLGSG